MKDIAYWTAFLACLVGLVAGLACAFLNSDPRPAKTYTVEAFTESYTLRLKCTGPCDPAALKSEVAAWLKANSTDHGSTDQR